MISFTRGAQDVLDVLRARGAASAGRRRSLDVVPLFESADALATAGPIVEQLLADAALPAPPRRRAATARR